MNGFESTMHFKLADMGDSRLLYEWANDPETRAASFNTALIDYAGHEKWLAAKIADPGCRIMLFYSNGDPVGQVRFDMSGNSLEVGIVTAPNVRGKGYAVQMLRAAIRYVSELWKGYMIHAHIKPTNSASVKVFAKAGFIGRGLVDFKGHNCLLMEAEASGKTGEQER